MAALTIIDTDPGIDDAVAILLALSSGEFEIVGVTTVAGNIGIETTTRNALRILAHLDRAGIPVVSGASRPLARKGFDPADIHGDDGLGGVEFPEPIGAALGADAVSWVAARLMAEPELTLDILAIGPLTNIARLALDHPRAAQRIRRLIVMGGAIHEPGNVGPRSEFNIAADPEAADIVFRAGLKLTLIPLDVTRKVRATRDFTARLRTSGTNAAVASADLIDAYFQSTVTHSKAAESRPLHDPCVMLFALAPGLFACETLNLAVDTGNGPDAGALSIDPAGTEVSVAMRVDAAGVLDLLMHRLTAA